MIRIGVLAAVVAAVILAASSASGQVTRAFVAGISPSTGIAGGATTTYTLTITNCPGSPCDSQYSSQQSLGSANVTAPYPITSISGLVTCPVPLPNKGAPCATLASPTSILLRNLKVAPGDSASVSFEATAPCSGGPYSWSVAAKSTGDFNGADFQLVTPSTLTTTLGSVCTLAFDDQPAGTVVNTTITSSAYDSSAGPVTVKVLDGNGNPLTAGTYPVTIGLAPCAPDPTSLLACGTGSLSSGSNTLTTNTSTSSGIDEASFVDLSIPDT